MTEHAPVTAEKTPTASAEGQLELLEKRHESAGERSNEQKEQAVEKARVEAKEHAISTEAGGAEKDTKPATAAPKSHGVIGHKQKEASFKKHMKAVQAEMSAPSRTFSKFIHAKPIEKASEFIGGTIARPDAILAGAVVAFVLVLGVYLLAKALGYVLSGFETIAAFIVGWILGIIYDYLKSIITGKPS